MPNYTYLTNYAGEQPIIGRPPSELAATERYRKNNIPKPASIAIKGDDITFSARPNPQNRCGPGFMLTTPTTIGPSGHIPVKARRNIIPFLEHAVFLEPAIVNRWCNICVYGYTQLPPHLRYQSALTFAQVISLRVHNTQPNDLYALLIQLQKNQYFEIAEDLQKGHPLPTVLIVPRNRAFTHKAFSFHKVDQLANEITLLGLVVDISMG